MKNCYGGIGLRDLKKFKQRTYHALTEGWIEKGVEDTCKVINKHPAFTTVWACQGHGPYSKKNAPNNCHVILVGANEYIHLVHEFIQVLMESELSPLWELSLCRLVYPDSDGYLLEDMTLKNTYNAWRVGYNFCHTEPTLRIVRKVLNDAAYKVFYKK